MTEVSGAQATVQPVGDVLADYEAFVDQLPCAGQGKRLRRRAAQRFLARWPDPQAWMERPTAARLVNLSRTGAWPFVTWCFITGVMAPDLDLLGARAKGAHFSAWASAHPHDVERALGVARELGWAPSWARQVCVNALALVCLTRRTTLAGLDGPCLDVFAEELASAPSISANHRKVLGGRLSGLRQVCFQLGLLDEAPPHPNSRPRCLIDHVAAIPQPRDPPSR